MSLPAKLSQIPVFLEAKSKEELMRLMFRNNALNGRRYDYFPPMLDGKKWVVWFYADIEVDMLRDLEDSIKEVKKERELERVDQ